MPQVAQFQLPTPGQPKQQQPQAQLPAGAPAVMQFQLPQSAQQQPSQINSPADLAPYLPPSATIGTPYAPTQQQGKDYLAGSLKGLAGLVQGADVLDTMHKMAGEPTLSQDFGVTGNPLAPSNPSQQAGAIGTNIAALATPLPEIEGARAASAAAKAPDIAADIASAPNTVKNVTKGLMSLGTNPVADKDAAAITPMVESGALKAGNSAKTTLQNSNALKDAIRTTSQALVQRLKGAEIKNTVQPEDLNGILQDAYKTIEKTLPPSQQENAKTTTAWIFQKLIDNTPHQPNGDILPEDLLSGRQATDQEVGAAKGNQVFDPATETGYTTGLRAIRQGANKVVAAKAPDAGVQEALAHQTSLYNVLENVAKKGAGAVKKAEEVASAPGIKGLMARHPIATEIAKYGLGIGTASAVTGEAVSHALNSQ